MNTTDRNRSVFLALFVIVVLGALWGWYTGHPVADLQPIFVPLIAALGIGEASAVGKRATSNPAVIEAEARVAGCK